MASAQSLRLPLCPPTGTRSEISHLQKEKFPDTKHRMDRHNSAAFLGASNSPRQPPTNSDPRTGALRKPEEVLVPHTALRGPACEVWPTGTHRETRNTPLPPHGAQQNRRATDRHTVLRRHRRHLCTLGRGRSCRSGQNRSRRTVWKTQSCRSWHSPSKGLRSPSRKIMCLRVISTVPITTECTFLNIYLLKQTLHPMWGSTPRPPGGESGRSSERASQAPPVSPRRLLLPRSLCGRPPCPVTVRPPQGVPPEPCGPTPSVCVAPRPPQSPVKTCLSRPGTLSTDSRDFWKESFFLRGHLSSGLPPVHKPCGGQMSCQPGVTAPPTERSSREARDARGCRSPGLCHRHLRPVRASACPLKLGVSQALTSPLCDRPTWRLRPQKPVSSALHLCSVLRPWPLPGLLDREPRLRLRVHVPPRHGRFSGRRRPPSSHLPNPAGAARSPRKAATSPVLASLSLRGTQESGRGWGRGSGSRDGGGRCELPRTPGQDQGCSASCRPRAHRSGASGLLQGLVLGAHRRAHRPSLPPPRLSASARSLQRRTPRGSAETRCHRSRGAAAGSDWANLPRLGKPRPEERDRDVGHTFFRDVYGLSQRRLLAPQNSQAATQRPPITDHHKEKP